MFFVNHSTSIENMSNRHCHSVLPADPAELRPSQDFPIRVTARVTLETTEVSAHSHAWPQIVFSDTGVVRVTTDAHAFVVPPQHAVWIPKNVAHSAIVLESARLFSIYIYLEAPCDEKYQAMKEGDRCHVLAVTPLLLELVRRLSNKGERLSRVNLYRAMCDVVFSELSEAATVPLGVPMPRDHRLRSLCQRFIASPKQHLQLGDLARQSGASVSTSSRLFRQELGMTFGQWRQQALLARALTLAASKTPIGLIAEELGYATPSAFSAMVTRALGAPPREFLFRR